MPAHQQQRAGVVVEGEHQAARLVETSRERTLTPAWSGLTPYLCARGSRRRTASFSSTLPGDLRIPATARRRVAERLPLLRTPSQGTGQEMQWQQRERQPIAFW